MTVHNNHWKWQKLQIPLTLLHCGPWWVVFCCWNAIIGFQCSLFVTFAYNGWPSTIEPLTNIKCYASPSALFNFSYSYCDLWIWYLITPEKTLWWSKIIQLCVCSTNNEQRTANDDSQHRQYHGAALYSLWQESSQSVWMIGRSVAVFAWSINCERILTLS